MDPRLEPRLSCEVTQVSFGSAASGADGARQHGSMGIAEVFERLGVTCAAYAAPVAGDLGAGVRADELVTPASVTKIQVALAAESLIAGGFIPGSSRRLLRSRGPTPGPVGISLMRDEVSVSVRDLVVAMLTLSDNPATDELITAIGLEEVNRATSRLGLTQTAVQSDLRTMFGRNGRRGRLRRLRRPGGARSGGGWAAVGR